MTDPKKPDLPDLPEKIEATAGKEPETVQVARPMEDSSTRALSDALSSSFKIIFNGGWLNADYRSGARWFRPTFYKHGVYQPC